MASKDSSPFHWHYDKLDDKNFQVHGRTLLLLILILFSLLLLIIFTLFLRWYYRYRRLSPTTTFITDITPHTSTLPTHSVGLDLATIDSFPIFLHGSLATTTTTTTTAAAATTTAKEESQCSICLCKFEDEEKVKILPDCRHTYHPGCIDQWLSRHSSCPLCRASLRVKTLGIP